MRNELYANDIIPGASEAAVSSECQVPSVLLPCIYPCVLRTKGTFLTHTIMIPRCIQRSHVALRRIDVYTRLSPHGLRFLTASPTPTPSGLSKFSRYGRKTAKYTAFTCFSAVLGLSVVIGGVFIHDVFTYSDKHIDRVPVSPLALHPDLGGPKNLPVASVLVGDGDDGAQAPVVDKPKLVIVGGGWGVRYVPFISTVF